MPIREIRMACLAYRCLGYSLLTGLIRYNTRFYFVVQSMEINPVVQALDDLEERCVSLRGYL